MNNARQGSFLFQLSPRFKYVSVLKVSAVNVIPAKARIQSNNVPPLQADPVSSTGHAFSTGYRVKPGMTDNLNMYKYPEHILRNLKNREDAFP